jgi:serine/threonine protein kinase
MQVIFGIFLLLQNSHSLFDRKDLPSYVFDSRFKINSIDVGHVIPTNRGEVSVQKEIGHGVFGRVYGGVLNSGSLGRVRVAIKCQLPNAPKIPFIGMVPKQYSFIQHEFKMMLMMSGKTGFPTIYTGNFKGSLKCYVMELLGPSLDSMVRKSEGQRFRSSIALPVAIQMLNRIETLHREGFLAYDLHLGNFLYKHGTVYLIDLGLACPYIVNGEHVAPTGTHIPNGVKKPDLTTRHDSNGETYSRRDDVERVLILVVYLMTGRLPWSHKPVEQQISIKRKVTPKQMSQDLPWMRKLFEYVFALGFDEEPRYDLIRDVFEDRLQRRLEV